MKQLTLGAGCLVAVLALGGCGSAKQEGAETATSASSPIASAPVDTSEKQVRAVIEKVMRAYDAGDQAVVIDNSLGTVYKEVVNETPADFMSSVSGDRAARGSLATVAFAHFVQKNDVASVDMTATYQKIPQPNTSTVYAINRNGWKVVEIDPVGP